METIEITLNSLLENNNYTEIKSIFESMNEFDIAIYLDSLPYEQAVSLYKILPAKLAEEVFVELDFELQTEILSSLEQNQMIELVETIPIDDAADLFQQMPQELSDTFLKAIPPETRNLISKYLKYSEDSVGSVMTAEYTSLSKNMTVIEAIRYIREHGENKETIYTCYVVDSLLKLIGVVTLRDLLNADDNAIVGDIMRSQIVSVTAQEDKEEAALLINKYNFISLPVIDSHYRLIGIVTIDDAADVFIEETTEDMEKMAGIAPSEKPYLKTSILKLAQNRFLWLFILMISGVFSEMILAKYESIISVVPLLVAFIPLLSDMGGDAGSQVSTLIIRGMALNEITEKDSFLIMAKELVVSLIVGVPLAIFNFARIVISNPADAGAGAVISLTLIFTLIFSNTLGVILPVVAKKMKIDPALMASPMIASIVDILSMIIYFFIAKLIIL